MKKDQNHEILKKVNSMGSLIVAMMAA